VSVIASVHVADLGFPASMRLLRRVPEARSIDGLRQANLALAAPLGRSIRHPPPVGRVAMLAFWDSADAVERFEATHPLAARLAGGWRAWLEPLRAYGSWPGLPAELSADRSTDHAGPSVVLTLGRLRWSQAVRFFRASGKAERAALVAPGMIWATGLARPPFVATCSLWASTPELTAYAYGRGDPGHPAAIAAHVDKPFHHESAFVRFRPVHTAGSLDGRNPLAAGAGALAPPPTDG
jgi:hypothetical protein